MQESMLPPRSAGMALALALVLVPETLQAAAGRVVFLRHSGSGASTTALEGPVEARSSDFVATFRFSGFPAEMPASRERSGAETVYFESPFSYNVSADVQLKLPSGDPSVTWTATFELVVGHETICKAAPATRTGASDTTVSASLSTPCRETQLGTFLTLVGLFGSTVRMTLMSSRGIPGGGEVFALTSYQFLEDEIFLDNVSPSTSSVLTARQARTLTGRGSVGIQSMASGRLELAVYDQRGQRLGASTPVSLTRTLTGREEFALSIPDVTPSESTTELTLRAEVFEAGSGRRLPLGDPELEPDIVSDEYKFRVKPTCALSGVISRSAGGKTYWLPDTLVDLLDGDRVVAGPVKAKADAENPSIQSAYCFPALPATFDYKKEYALRVRLQDSDTLNTFGVLGGTVAVYAQVPRQLGEAQQPMAILSLPFQVGNGVPNRQDLRVTKEGTGIAGIEGEKLEAGAEAYWHAWRERHRMEAQLPDGFAGSHGPNFPISVFLNREGRTSPCPGNGDKVRSCYCDNDLPTCPSPMQIYGIVLGPGASTPGADPSTLFHEYGHYVAEGLWVGRPGKSAGVDQGSPFLGYYNATTADSLYEGLALFWAALSSRVLEQGPPWFTPSEPAPDQAVQLSLEPNHAAWDQRADSINAHLAPEANEYLAVAGLLHDLVDFEEDEEPAPDVMFVNSGSTFTPKDTVSVDGKALLTLIQRDKPATVLALRAALAAGLPGELTSPSRNPRGSGLSQLDEVFVMHRFFHDANGNFRYDLDEEVGRAANGGDYFGTLRAEKVSPRPSRAEPPTTEGSFVDLRFVTEDGREVEDATVRVVQRFGPGFERFNLTTERPLVGGRVYFPMPPPHYPVEVSFSIPGRDEPPKVFDSALFAAGIGRGDTFFSTTMVVPPPGPEIFAVVPQRGAPGATATLHGQHFGSPVGRNTVTFGGAPAPVVSAKETELVVTVPASLREGAAPVVVKTADGESQPLTFTVDTPVVSLTPSSYGFGTLFTGSTRETTVTLANVGLAPLAVLSASSHPAFTLSPKPPFTVAPGETRSLNVAFRPAREGSAEGTLYLVTNDPARRLAGIDLTGAGSSPFGPALEAGPAAIDLGKVKVGESRTVFGFLQNVGSADVTVSSAAAQGAAFSVTSSPALPATLAPYASARLDVVFTPASPGPASGSVTVTSTDPARPTITIPVRGEGIATATELCSFGVAPLAVSVGASGGRPNLTLTTSCPWTITSVPDFVTLPRGTSGLSGTTVQVIVGANPNPTPRSGTLTVNGFAVRVEQDAAPFSQDAFVPVVLSAAGAAGAFFTSELTLTNRGSTDAILDVTYTPFTGEGRGTARDALPAGTQLVFKDALSYLASLGLPVPASGNRGGTVRIEAAGGSSPAAVAATARTATAVPDGRAGLSYPAVPPRLLNGPVTIGGLRQNATDRSNVAVQNTGAPGEGDVVLRLTVHSGDPANPLVRALPEVGLPPGGFAQFSGILAGNGLSLSNGYVKVEKIGGTAPFYAYGVINDQVTSDGSFIPPVVDASLAGRTGLTVPVIVETGPFSSELVATNASASRKNVRLAFVADAITAADKTATLTLDLAPGEQRIIPGFVQFLRDRGVAGIGPAGTTYAGALFVSVPGGDVQGLVVGARTASAAPGGRGSYGLFYTGVPSGAAATGTAWVYGLQQDAENRANLALVNTGDVDGSGSAYRIELYDGATGRLARTIETSLPARGWTQLSRILTQYAPGVTSAYARVVKLSGSNQFLAYGVINDGGAPGERSGDGAFVTMEIGE